MNGRQAPAVGFSGTGSGGGNRPLPQGPDGYNPPQYITPRTRPMRHLFAALALLAAGTAFADDYADVGELLRAGQSAQALARADQYLAAKPRDPQMRFLKGMALTQAGRTADAIAAYTALTEEYPELPEPYNNLAVLYAGQGQLDKARAALEVAVRANPAYAVAHENLGDIHARLAEQAWARALQLDPQLAMDLRPKLAAARQLTEAGRAKPPARPASTP